ncbi:ABC transporter permease [Acrocarpospora pleiomorpha]|uniref:ABC transporter permease n=1 Tax=Acrocarpospora pleiomorpha TaxID=90975 RepID=A0A5M3XRP5_9ACTN|nr:ABC transporter permease [Acrocarpospora pleiomorpha]GES23480.1 ABC transporter permease [Acrocarpospora pleiomorpha]
MTTGKEVPQTPHRDTFANRLIGRIKLNGLMALAAPVLAILFAGLITSLVLILTDHPPVDTLLAMVEYGSTPRSIVLIINLASAYYLSAMAVALGFRMNLFNIGVDGQYRLAALCAAAVGGAVALPKPLHIGLIIVVAVVVGAAWAGIAGVLKAKRGVSEVISTIMLNTIATGLGAWLLAQWAVPVAGSNNIGTNPIPESGHAPGIPLIPQAPNEVFGLFILAVLVGIGFHVLLNRTRFGFNLRSTGLSEPAAVASGVNVKKMIVIAMLISGGMAGLVGMPQLLGSSYSYSLDFPPGFGFTGIAIALIGRNNPIGVAFGALLWSFLDVSQNILSLKKVSPEIVTIMQGVIVLAVVIAYELVHRYRIAAEQRRVSRELSASVHLEGAAA